jgi:hypothetical protein
MVSGLEACNRTVVVDVNATGRSFMGAAGKRCFFKGSFVVDIDTTSSDGGITYSQYTVGSEAGNYFKSDNIKGYVTTYGGARTASDTIWRLALIWDEAAVSPVGPVFEAGESGGDGTMSVLVTTHTTDADSGSGGRLVLSSSDKTSPLGIAPTTEPGSAVLD